MTYSTMWETTYRHDRRAHRHRCHACNKIIEAGEAVLMWRVPGARATRAVHAECANAPHPCGTWRDAIAIWANAAPKPRYTGIGAEPWR